MSSTECHSSDDNSRSDSYFDRVCDDLSEVILQFLSFEDKFRLECVSKQFQRTVFNRHYDLNIRKIERLLEDRDSDLRNFETILKKLPNIRYFVDNNYPIFLSSHKLNDSELELIMKYSKNLVSFHWDLSEISENKMNLFLEKFGSKLKSFSTKVKDFELIQSQMKNIEELDCTETYLSLEQIFQLRFKKLTKFSIEIIYFKYEQDHLKKQMNDFRTFVENHSGITHLSLILIESSGQDIKYLFWQISRLKNLVSLKIDTKYTSITNKSLNKCLKHMATNCLKLKSLTIYSVHYRKDSVEPLFVEQLKNFKELRELDIDLKCNECLLNESFKGLENLTHLSINFQTSQPIKEILLKDIDINLPNLQTLVVWNQFESIEKSIDILCRLSRLKTIKLFVGNKYFRYTL